MDRAQGNYSAVNMELFAVLAAIRQLKGLSHQIFKAFFITYDIKSVLSGWALMVFKFFYSLVILSF